MKEQSGDIVIGKILKFFAITKIKITIIQYASGRFKKTENFFSNYFEVLSMHAELKSMSKFGPQILIFKIREFKFST